VDNGRLLKRGTRGEDVFAWQTFLVKARQRPDLKGAITAIAVDGKFGLQTARATIGFQIHFGLKPDGVVGPRTREVALGMGLVLVPYLPNAHGPAVAPGPGQTAIPLIPPSPPPPPPPGPPPPQGSTRDASWQRLRAEGWSNAGGVKQGLTAGNAVLQSATQGTGDYVYDEYRVDVTMPANLTAEALLLELARDLNGTIHSGKFDSINVFKRRRSGDPQVGEIIDIDIEGPDNGSVILGELGATYFVFQTIDCPQTGSHPENGSREFGFQRNGDQITYYTRGVSRPSSFIVGWFGAGPQQQGWTALMQGISDTIVKRGGKSSFSTFHREKEKRQN